MGPGRMPVWRGYRGPSCPDCHMSPLPMECRTSPFGSIGVELTGLRYKDCCTSLGDATHPRWPGREVTSSAAGVPLSHPSNEDVSRSGVAKTSLVRPGLSDPH